ncbi:MAG: hypothetical protein F6K00_33465 [Leptolyngbya sp. SIOISBB]|nr:hypothetical protein [Leptolyngbya sp. SIOISBB]
MVGPAVSGEASDRLPPSVCLWSPPPIVEAKARRLFPASATPAPASRGAMADFQSPDPDIESAAIAVSRRSFFPAAIASDCA